MKLQKELMDQLIKDRKEAIGIVNDIDRAITSLQKLCDHEWVGTGHDSHKDHYKCSICQVTESR